MISAAEAKRKSIINEKGKKYLDALEKCIEDSIKLGSRSATMSIDLQKYDKDIMEAIEEELTRLGYDITFEYANILPYGYPLDNGFITVEW